MALDLTAIECWLIEKWYWEHGPGYIGDYMGYHLESQDLCVIVTLGNQRYTLNVEEEKENES